MFKILHFGVKFLSDLAQARERKVYCRPLYFKANINPLEDNIYVYYETYIKHFSISDQI